MKIQKISLSFSGYSDANFATKARFILDSLNGNPLFPNPTPPLADVEDAYVTYNTARLAAEGLGKVKVADKNKYRKLLEQQLVTLGQWVMFIANGDAATLTSSGYSLTKMPEPQRLDNPGNVSFSNGISTGQLVVSVIRPNGSISFIHEIASELPTETTVWTSTPSSRSRFTFTSLQPGKQYWVRVAAVGSNEQIAYSPVASQFAQ